MTNPFTEAWAEAQATPAGDVVELWTAELIHPAILDANGQQISVRAVADTQDHTLTLEDSAPFNGGQAVLFSAIPFEVPWPETEDGRAPSLKLRIDNVGRELMPYLDAAVRVDAPLQVIFRCFLWQGSDAAVEPGTDPMTFLLRQVTVNDQFVEGTASPADLDNLQFLRMIYDIATYPALTQ